MPGSRHVRTSIGSPRTRYDSQTVDHSVNRHGEQATPRVHPHAAPGRRTPAELPGQLPPADDPIPSPRELLLHTWPAGSSSSPPSLKLLVGRPAPRRRPCPASSRCSAAPRPSALSSRSSSSSRGCSCCCKRRLLWRVRRKLILSYIFIGVVPSLLIIGFFLLGAWVVAINVGAYLFRDGYDDVVNYVELVGRRGGDARCARNPARADRDDGADPAGGEHRRPAVSRAVDGLPARPSAGARTAVRTGDVEPRARPPDHVPAWIGSQPGEFVGTVAIPAGPTAPTPELDRAGRGAGVAEGPPASASSSSTCRSTGRSSTACTSRPASRPVRSSSAPTRARRCRR